MTQTTSEAGWLEIETAPKAETSSEPPVCVMLSWFNVTEDGRRTYHVGEGYWHPDGGAREEGAWWWANTAPGDYYDDCIEESITGHVTHWQPLPDPPALCEACGGKAHLKTEEVIVGAGGPETDRPYFETCEECGGTGVER